MNQQDNDSLIIADKVREFYDRHPYPPPVTGLDDYRRRWQDEGRRRARHIYPQRRLYLWPLDD